MGGKEAKQWTMLNNPWPGMIWHTFDYYFNAGGVFYAIKKALSPLHATFSYDQSQVHREILNL